MKTRSLAPASTPANYVIATLVHKDVHAEMAQSLMPIVLQSWALIQAHNDEPKERSPVHVARMVCDLAQALMNEFDERGWLVRVPEPPPQSCPKCGKDLKLMNLCECKEDLPVENLPSGP
ncbi:MAG: hypothetical protein JWO52_3338 [Gammaproteobacteria bacterium]|nr:hypothetical protein [Gammaproteobacteria bacterium]